MESSKTNKLYIDKETLVTLALAQEGILGPIDKLMNKDEARATNEEGLYKNSPLPLSFILAPNGKINQANIKNAKKGDILHLVCEKKLIGEIEVESSYKINKYNRIKRICGVFDENRSDVKKLVSAYGNYALSGRFRVDCDEPKRNKEKVRKTIESLNAKNITGVIFGTKPFNRAHERIIRTALEKTDLLIIFLMRSQDSDDIPFEIREKILNYFIDTYLPKSKAVVVPLENSYIFSKNTNLPLQCVIASNFGCNKLIIGHNHDGIGMYYDKNQPFFVMDKYKNKLPIEVVVVPEYVFCNKCKTLVSTITCPHGSHHHIKYHGKSLKKLLNAGILPPALFIRRDISSMILSELFPNRLKDIQSIYDNLFPNSGLLEEHSERDFYETLMILHQTTSMV